MKTSSRGRARIGVLVPFTNTNLEPDLAMMRPPGVSFHFSRMAGYDIDAIPDAGQMAAMGEASLHEPLRLLAGVRPDVVLYGCTSATLTHGPAFDRDLARRIEGQIGAATVTAAGALIEALKMLGIGRVGFASPYVTEINDLAISYLGNAGFETVSRADIGVALDNITQGALTPDEVIELGRRADSAEAEAIVMSCTDMRSIEIIERLEADLGKPVISSNQAMMVAARQALGMDSEINGCGRLSRPMPRASVA